jgi:hypothetical protein
MLLIDLVVKVRAEGVVVSRLINDRLNNPGNESTSGDQQRVEEET